MSGAVNSLSSTTNEAQPVLANSTFLKLASCLPVVGMCVSIVVQESLLSKINQIKEEVVKNEQTRRLPFNFSFGKDATPRVIELINLTNEFKCAQVVGHVISIAFALYAITIPAISALGVGMALSNIALIALSVYYIHQNNKVIDDVQKTGYSFTPVRSFIQSTQAIIQNSLSGFKD